MDVSHRHTSAAAATIGALLVAACGSSPDDDTRETKATRGGTLYYLSSVAAEYLDPQRVYAGREIANLGRLVYRGLVTYPATDDPDDATRLVPDVATDTGTMSADAKTWQFTIRDGVTWQDGRPVTCEDFTYGISRTFATDVITGGPTYILSYLDVPETPSGLPAYDGPYTGDGQAAYDRAVSCDDDTLTLRFRKPWPDFNYAAASLHAFDPYREDQDRGAKSKFQVFSNGPYQLDGDWKPGAGGTFVRNRAYDPASDETGARQALPDRIEYREGEAPEVLYDRLVADNGNDRYAVTDQSAPPSSYTQITGAVEDRASTVSSPFVSYLVPNFDRLENPQVRQALLHAADVTAWLTALGGDKAGTPAGSIVHPQLIGYRDNPAFTAPPDGDPETARDLLEDSGADLPFPISFAYLSQGPSWDKAAAALAESWNHVGFDVTLDPSTETYFGDVSSPGATFDVAWGGWGADWPSMGTVLPPLFDSRVNLTSASSGQDYGRYHSEVVNQLIDDAAAMTDVDQQAAAYAEIDEQLGRDVAYIPLEVVRFYFLRGSRVTGYLNNPATAGYPDLGAIGVVN